MRNTHGILNINLKGNTCAWGIVKLSYFGNGFQNILAQMFFY